MTKTKTMTTVNTSKDVTKTITKRWAVVRRSTGSIVRKFATRDLARSYKDSARTLRIYDTATQQFVR